MNILITGGAGFVGSHLAEALVNLGHTVSIIDNYSTGRLKNVQNLHVEVKHQDVSKITTGIDKYDVIFHLAAKPFSKAKTDWFSESNSIFQSNVVGTHNILRLINPNSHFILASSASIYGSGQRLTEELPYNPLSAYGYSKTLAEQVTIYSNRHYTIVRPGTIIGPRGRCFPNRVMWSIVHNKQCKFFKNGTVLRDIIDVQDVVYTLIEIMNQHKLGIYNLGSNTTTSGMQLATDASRIANEIGLKLNLKLTDFVPNDFVQESTLNSNKLYSAISWTPKIKLSESLGVIYDYYYSSLDKVEPPSWDNL